MLVPARSRRWRLKRRGLAPGGVAPAAPHPGAVLPYLSSFEPGGAVPEEPVERLWLDGLEVLDYTELGPRSLSWFFGFCRMPASLRMSIGVTVRHGHRCDEASDG